MLSGEGNENCEKTKIGLISKKATFARAAHFLCTFLCRCFARLHVLRRKCCTCSCHFFFHCRSFSPRWPLAFLIFSPPLQNFMLFLQQKMSPLFLLSRSSSFSCWASLACRLTFSFFLCLSLSLFSKFVDMTINLTLILKTTGYRNNFPFPFSSLLTL